LAFVLLASPLASAPTPATAADPVVMAAGDISCARLEDGTSTCRDQATSDLVMADLPDRVLALGDNQYSGTLSEFQTYYEPTWGRFKNRTSPTPGNHDPFSSDYPAYFTPQAPARHYAFDLGNWRLYSLDSNNVDSLQVQWLETDLAANPRNCVLAYWHHARFSSGTTHGGNQAVSPLWQVLYEAGAEIVLTSHEHNYERFAPQTAAGGADPARGIREFVVGTGGRSHYMFGSPQPNSEARNSDTFGVLKLTLHPGSYDWQFVPEAGQMFDDSGSESCHSASDGYARPNSATPIVVRLVPAYRECVDATGLHGAPLVADSCNPPIQVSEHLTLGTPEANGKAASSTGSAQLKVVGEHPIDPGNGDQADVVVTVALTDVLKRSDLSDYTGQLEAVLTLRMTDRYSGPSLNTPATAVDLPLRFTVPCAATPGAEGGSCQLTTTVDGLMADAAREGRRAIWELGQISVFDGGADGAVSTTGNRLFAVQGGFAP
jgi:calcineurin-like phosphoesterase family protein